ncbi:MAG: serine hydrolase [Rhodothermales bacterium]|nr:serine hydrolase [Rhodothermales bacterium]
MLRILPLFVLLLLSSFPSVAQPAPPGIDSYTAAVLSAFEVPGIALAIVKDGRVVLAKGYGVRELGNPAPVDDRTLFGIASNSKAFTATALALLVEEGRLGWEDRVIDHLPWFQLSDAFVTRELTIRDLLVHRSGLGLGAGDLLWWPASTYNRREVAERLRYLPLVTSFRSAYAYDNVLYLVAGEVIETLSGMSWEDFVQTRILDRVGMADSNPRHSDAGAPGANVAVTHARVDGVVRPIAPFTSDNTNPAGGINASARDIARWMIVQLDSGRVAGDDRLFSRRTARELWTPLTPTPIGTPPPDLAPLQRQFSGYALGFDVHDYRGHKVVTHTGGLPGYVSKVTMIPELKLGVAVFTNQESGRAFTAMTYHVLDHYLGANDTDWLVALANYEQQGLREIADTEAAIATERNAGAGPSLSPAAYVGTYTDAWYGDILVEQKPDGALELRFSRTPSLVGSMEHWQYDTFIVRWYDRELRADAFITFALHPDGSIDQARMQAVSPATDFSYDFQDLLLKPAIR